jgi:hypothetical protein
VTASTFSGQRVETGYTRAFADSIYYWLTKDPDPEVIVVVIDLRESYTVGPFIALCNRLAPTLERAWREPRAKNLFEGLQTAANATWLTDSRTVQILAAALEPPEPPEASPEDDEPQDHCPGDGRRR